MTRHAAAVAGVAVLALAACDALIGLHHHDLRLGAGGAGGTVTTGSSSQTGASPISSTMSSATSSGVGGGGGQPCSHAPLVVHESPQAKWTIWDGCKYAPPYKEVIDDIVATVDKAIPAVLEDLGSSVVLPVAVQIQDGGCCGSFAGGGMVGLNLGDFDPNAILCANPGLLDARLWTRGVVIGEFVNFVTGESVSGGWPRDWWVDDVWYFPGMVVVQVLKQAVDDTTASAWEQRAVGCPETGYPSFPVYLAFDGIRKTYGWKAYQDAFAKARADQMNWNLIGANPSALRTNYVIAYLSLGAGASLASLFTQAQVSGVDANAIQAIEDVRARLPSCTPAIQQAAAWTAYRNGDYPKAGQMCP